MRVNYQIDLSRAQAGLVCITADFSRFPGGTDLLLPGLEKKPGVEVSDLQVKAPGQKARACRVSGERIAWPGKKFSLRYSLRIGLNCSIGTDTDSEFLYPFLNDKEIFLGSGALPYPDKLPLLADSVKATLRVTGAPAGFRMFSSIDGEELCPGQLDSFFIYFSGKVPATHIYSGRAGKTGFSLLVQRGKTIPLTRAEIWRHTDRVMRALESNFAPYNGFCKLKVLILQPPADFENISGGRTFATGENVHGGIAIYAPKSPAYLRRRLGCSSYAYLLRDGLAHELTHFYSTTAWQGRYKSMLFPAETCLPRQKHLIGEVLTSYFHQGIVRCAPGKKPSFISGKIRPLVAAAGSKPGKRSFLDLFLLDLWLRQGRSSLKAAVRIMLKEYGARHKPYSSAKDLIKAAEVCRGPLPAWLKKTLLTDYGPDYAKELQALPGWRKADFSPLSDGT